MNDKEKFNELINEQRYEEARALLEKNKAMAYEDSFYFANMGWVLNHIGRHQEAIAYLQKGIQAFPEDAWMYSQLGYAYNHANQFTEALKYLEKGLHMGHDEPWIHGEIGWAYRQLNEDKKAIEYFENALLDDPNNVWILAQAAFTYRDLGDDQSAEEYLRKVYRLDPSDDSLFDLAMFYKHAKRYEEEIALLKQMKNDAYADWQDFEIAYAYNRIDKEKDAVELLKRCLQRGRDDTGVREELGDAYWRIGDRDAAKQEYHTALSYYEKALVKNSADAYWILQDMAWIAHKEEDMIHKLQYLDRMSQIKPDDPWVLYHYAKTYANLGEYDRALTYCDRCEKAEGPGSELHSLKAWILGKKRSFAEAIEVLEETEKLGRHDAWLWNEIAWDYSEMGDYEKALTYYRKSLAESGDDPLIYSQLAWHESALGNYQKALTLLFKARELGREDGWLIANIGWNYAKLNQAEQASAYYDQAAAMGYQEPWFVKLYEQQKHRHEAAAEADREKPDDQQNDE